MQANKIIEQAKKWIGKKEIDGSFKEIIDTYNSYSPLPRGYRVKYSDSWCAVFVSAVAIKCNATSIIFPECSCEQMITLFKKKGWFEENETIIPSIGDIIFYDWQDNGLGDNKGRSDHVGIVEKCENGVITVIEGNKNNAVERRTIKVNGKYIRGYGLPEYEKNIDNEKNLEIAKEVIQGKWGNGLERKNLLLYNGYDYNVIQSIVNLLLRGK